MRQEIPLAPTADPGFRDESHTANCLIHPWHLDPDIDLQVDDADIRLVTHLAIGKNLVLDRADTSSPSRVVALYVAR